MIWNKAKSITKSAFPQFYVGAQRFRDQIWVELRVLRQLRLKTLLRTSFRRSDLWRKSLPVQSTMRFPVPLNGAGVQDAKSLSGLEGAACGGHAIYLSPERFRTGPLSDLATRYPDDAGLKIMRGPGDAYSGQYVFGSSHGYLQKAMTHSHPHLMLVANRLHIEGLAPRVYDLVELDAQGTVFTAYVVEHCPGESSGAESEECVKKLRELVAETDIELVIPDGFSHMDFCGPTFGGNIRRDKNGNARYVDFQSFRSSKHGEYLEKLAREAAAVTHFGDRSVLRGGHYLYQSIPGIEGGKRNIGTRMTTIDSLLAKSGISLSNRVVFDFGCNIGMVMAEYLRRGARWACGWDMPATVVNTERLLLGTGCTRFSLVGRQLSPDANVDEDIPLWLRSQLHGLVISYLAVHGHFGWLKALGRLPWTCLIYEGHEEESDQDGKGAQRILLELAGAQLAACAHYEDGDSRPRYVAIFVRNSN